MVGAELTRGPGRYLADRYAEVALDGVEEIRHAIDDVRIYQRTLTGNEILALAS